MEGVFINKSNIEVNTSGAAMAGIKLLAKSCDMEVMEQTIIEGATVWISPADDADAIEFFFIHSGTIEIELDSGISMLGPGDSVAVKGLKQDVIIKSKSNTRIVYVSNRPFFKEVHDFETYLKALLTQINEKDHYTYRHSMNVMNYSIAMYEIMENSFKTAETQLKDIVVASLFHDVGKCYTPDDILKKKGRLEPEEMKIIRHHPMDSGRLLRKYYNCRVAEIAENHHERIDGSGYPFGLCGGEISMEAKILAVADAFDAMTTERGYNSVKTFEEAAEELYKLPHLFDSTVTAILKKLVDSGEISKDKVKIDGQL